MSKVKHQSLTGIITILIFVVAIFLGFMTYSINSSIENTARLNNIKLANFPVLERIDINIVQIDRIKELLLQSMMTAEEDLIEETTPISESVILAFDEIGELSPELADDAAELKNIFTNYYKESSNTTATLINEMPDMEPSVLQAKVNTMNQALDALQTNISQFREENYNNFTQALEDSNQSAITNMYSGLAIGAMNLFFMGVLVYFIRNNFKMMDIISHQNETLEQRVKERTEALSQKTNDMNAMLSNMDLGVFTLVPGATIHPEYSAHLETILEQESLSGEHIKDVLLEKTSLGSNAKDQIEAVLNGAIGEESFNFDFNSHLLSNEVEFISNQNTSKILQLTWNPILTKDDLIEKILVTTKDITRLKKLEYESQKQQRELVKISQVIKISIGKYNEFINSSTNFFDENEKLIKNTNEKSPETIDALFRNMHTVKGNARTFELTELTDIVHEIEQEYCSLRDNTQSIWDPQKLLEGLEKARSVLAQYQHVNDNILGRKGRASDQFTARGSFVTTEQAVELSNLARSFVSSLNLTDAQQQASTTLLNKISSINTIPLTRVVESALDSLESLAQELGKPEPEANLSLHPALLDVKVAEPLKSSLMHIIRNSADHGIENVEDRRKKGKSDSGKITLNTTAFEDHIKLEIFDDGAGLPLHKIIEKAIEQNILDKKQANNLTATEIANLIFKGGLTTAEQVSQVSGRGVGMDAVKSFLTSNGMDISIELEEQHQEISFTPFKFIITLPNKVYDLGN